MIGIHGWVLDLLTYGPGLTVYHTLATVLYAAFMAGFWLPPTFRDHSVHRRRRLARRAARLAAEAPRSRSRSPPRSSRCSSSTSSCTLLFPNVVLDPEWRFPDDGIDEFGQKILKIQVVFAMYAVGAASPFFSG